jgi:hypothetical protein
MIKRRYEFETELLCTKDCKLKYTYTKELECKKDKVYKVIIDDAGVRFKIDGCYTYPFSICDIADDFVINHTTDIHADKIAIYTNPYLN